jgi:hypothetical protein
MPAWAFRGSGGKKGFALFFLTSIRIHLHTTLFATSTCGANVCKWAFCTTTSFQLRDYTGCIRHVFALGQCSMVTIGGCGSILRALGVSQILVFVARPRGEPGRLRRHVPADRVRACVAGTTRRSAVPSAADASRGYGRQTCRASCARPPPPAFVCVPAAPGLRVCARRPRPSCVCLLTLCAGTWTSRTSPSPSSLARQWG